LQQRASELIGARELTPVSGEIRKGSNLDPTRQQLAAQLVNLQIQREGLGRQLQSVIQTDAKLRQQYEKFPDRQLQQARLVQGVEFQRIIYQNILTALVDAQAAEAETSSSLIVAQEPFYQPARPFQAKKLNPKLILAAGAGIGTLAGLGLILLLALLDDRLQTPQELRDALTEREVAFLGQLPWIANSLSEEKPNPILLDGDSIYLPFYERVRSTLRRLRPDSSRVILIASISNEEGKSVTAYNLAVASAYAGRRTLLIEADLRAASKAEWVEITPDAEAALEPLRYYAARSETISLVPGIANLYVLPSPGPQRDAAAIIESSEFQLMLKDVRGRFDMVIVDVPSLSRCNDALLIEPLTDGIVLVVRPGVTRSSLLREATNQFIEAEIPVLGGVVNGVEGLATPLISTPTHPEAEFVDRESKIEEEVGVNV
jgi:capsular exopolysaccharide synthesis family protein